MSNRYAYTLKELIEANGVITSIGSTPTLNEIGTSLNLSIDFAVFNYKSDNVIIELWKRVYNRYYNSIACILDKEPSITSSNEYKEALSSFLVQMLQYINNEYETYKIRIDAYTSQKAKLFDRVKNISDSKSQFNDTPQDYGIAQEGDPYATNMTRVQASNDSDFNTPVARLKEVEDSIRNVYFEWVENIGKLFIEEANYIY